jgi:hypothetical protein
MPQLNTEPNKRQDYRGEPQVWRGMRWPPTKHPLNYTKPNKKARSKKNDGSTKSLNQTIP